MTVPQLTDAYIDELLKALSTGKGGLCPQKKGAAWLRWN